MTWVPSLRNHEKSRKAFVVEYAMFVMKDIQNPTLAAEKFLEIIQEKKNDNNN